MSNDLTHNLAAALYRGDDKNGVKFALAIHDAENIDIWQVLSELASAQVDTNHDATTPILVSTLRDNAKTYPQSETIFIRHAVKALSVMRKVVVGGKVA